MDTDNPDLLALSAAIGFAIDLTERNADTNEWVELTTALYNEHTAAQLAEMLTGAVAAIAVNVQQTTATAAKNASSKS